MFFREDVVSQVRGGDVPDGSTDWVGVVFELGATEGFERERYEGCDAGGFDARGGEAVAEVQDEASCSEES